MNEGTEDFACEMLSAIKRLTEQKGEFVWRKLGASLIQWN